MKSPFLVEAKTAMAQVFAAHERACRLQPVRRVVWRSRVGFMPKRWPPPSGSRRRRGPVCCRSRGCPWRALPRSRR